MTLPDHGRDCLDDLVGTEVVQVTISHCKRGMSKLPLNDADIDATPCQFARARVAKAVNMDTLSYAPEYRVACGQFTHIAGIEAKALVACEEETLCIIGPGGYPVVKLPRCLSINPDYPTLVSFTLEYSDGAVFKVHVAHPEAEHFLAPQLCPECQKKDAAVAEASNRRLVERSEKAVQLNVAEDLGG